MSDNDSAWLTAREAAARLGLSEAAVIVAIGDGRFPAERVPTPHGPIWLVWVTTGWTAASWETALSREDEAAVPVALAPSDSPPPGDSRPPAIPPAQEPPAMLTRPARTRPARTFDWRLKIGAGKLHIPVEEYRGHIEAGERWCTGCKRWHPAKEMARSFGQPLGLAKICRAAARARYYQRVARKAAP